MTASLIPGRLISRLTLTLALALLACSALVGSASAAFEVPSYRYSFGPDGTEGTSFKRVESVAVDQGTGEIYVLSGETLYKFDAKGKPVAFTGVAPYLSENRITGLANSGSGAQVAVDQTTHTVYVTADTVIRAFQADGEPSEFSAGPGAGTSEISGFSTSVTGVAVDSDGAIYVSNIEAETVTIFASTGASLTSFAANRPRAVDVAPDGRAYVREGLAGVLSHVPSQFPVAPTTTYGAGKRLDTFTSVPPGQSVDPLSGHVYLIDNENGAPGSYIDEFDGEGNFVKYLARPAGEPGTPGEITSTPTALAVAAGVEIFYVGTESGSYPNNTGQVAFFGPQPPGPPEIGVAGAYDVSAGGATARALVNPRKVATTYRFEYGTGDCSLPGSECAAIPLPDAPLGSGNKLVAVSQSITGLLAGTTYHLRVFAENSEGTDEVNRTFTTQTIGGAFGLPDSRAWELVSPPQKGDGGIIVNNQTLIQASASGDGLAYLSRGAMEEDPEGNRSPELSRYLAGRSPDGSWASKDITSSHQEANILQGQDEFFRFSEDLTKGLVEPHDETPLSPAATEYTPYIRDNTTTPPTYTPLLTEANVTSGVPWGQGSAGAGDISRVVPVGATADLSHVVLSASSPLLEGVSGGGLYLWSDAGGKLEAVSQLPAGEGGKLVGGSIGSSVGSIRHAISDDGSRVFWQSGDYTFIDNLGTKNALYLRDTVVNETTRLDKKTDGTGEGKVFPAFQEATPDGSVVYFTDSQQLVKGASTGGRDLYRCELAEEASEGCVALEDISAPAEGSGEEARVKEMVPAISEDGSRAYFVAEGVLDSTPNSNSETAVKDQPNLYLWEEGAGVRFIAGLAPGALPTQGDSAVWGVGEVVPSGRAAFRSSYASPNGRFLTFTSQRPLTGYANESPRDGAPMVEVFVYDAQSDSLQCASCIPTGAAPVGQESPAEGLNDSPIDPQVLWRNRQVSAILPETSGGLAAPAIRQPRVAHDDGRVFFNAFDPLVPADTNRNWDVYQYEPLGTGDCSALAGGAATARTPEGCVSLVSSGTAEGQSAFLESSPGGENAFFLTKGRLSVLDKDNAPDVYDARVDGVQATLHPVSECAGESCQPPAGAPPRPSLASASFHGAGNVAAEKKPAKHRKHKKRHPRAKHKSRRAHR